jgi:hypothetical protein
VLVPPVLAEAYKTSIVQSLALTTSGTWRSCEVAGGQRMINVANKLGEKAWKRWCHTTDYSIARAVFATVVGASGPNPELNLTPRQTDSFNADATLARSRLRAIAPYHLGEGLSCTHSPYSSAISDVWFEQTLSTRKRCPWATGVFSLVLCSRPWATATVDS